MALSNIYKPQTNKFSHLGSDDDFDDEDDEDLDDGIDDGYSKNFTAFHSPLRSGHKPLLQQSNRKTKIRRVQARPWCTTKSCVMCFLWLAFFSICVTGLVLIIFRALGSMDVGKDSKTSSVKKVLHEQEQLSDNSDLIDACDTFQVEKVWHTKLSKLMTETAVRLNDVNQDGVKDIMMGFSTGVDGYNAPRVACDLYFNGSYPCFGGILALDGISGKELWRHYTAHEVYAINCDADVDRDGVWDCLIGGRAGVFQAVSGKLGKLLWNFGSQEARQPIMNIYTAQFIQDLNGDGIMEVLASHGGDPLAEPGSAERLVGRLIIFSGKTGQVLKWVKVPDERETYLSPVIYTQKDGTDIVVFGTGGETHPGGLWVIPLMDIYKGIIETSRRIYQDMYKGIMLPPILADLNKDGTVDISMAMFNTTFVAFDGETFERLWEVAFPDSESYSTPGAGYYNKDDTPDFMVKYNYGSGFPVYYYSNVTVIDGKTGKPLVVPSFKASSVANTSPLSVSMQGLGNDLFIYWIADCLGHEGEGGKFKFVEGTNVHEQTRADTCQLRFNTASISKLYVMSRSSGFPGETIYYSEKYKSLEHSGSDDPTGKPTLSTPSADRKKHKRHIGVPDHGGYQRLIATGALVSSLGTEQSTEPVGSIDVVFPTYWQYPAKVRVILPEDKACIERLRKLSKIGKFNNDADSDVNEKLGIYDAGDSAVNECLKQRQQKKKGKIFISQNDFDLYKMSFGAMTTYRFKLTCSCSKLRPGAHCGRFLPMSHQSWAGYMGTLGNSLFIPRPNKKSPQL